MKREPTITYRYETEDLKKVVVRCPSGGHGAGHETDIERFGPGVEWKEVHVTEYIGHETCSYESCGHNEGFICARCRRRMCWCAGNSGCCDTLCNDCWVEVHRDGGVCMTKPDGGWIGPGLQWTEEGLNGCLNEVEHE